MVLLYPNINPTVSYRYMPVAYSVPRYAQPPARMLCRGYFPLVLHYAFDTAAGPLCGKFSYEIRIHFGPSLFYIGLYS